MPAPQLSSYWPRLPELDGEAKLLAKHIDTLTTTAAPDLRAIRRRARHRRHPTGRHRRQSRPDQQRRCLRQTLWRLPAGSLQRQNHPIGVVDEIIDHADTRRLAEPLTAARAGLGARGNILL
jgi:hypothetical protein